MLTVSQYEIASMKTRKYQYSGCGDPYNTRYENLNVLPYVPPSPSQSDRVEQCMEWGCTESHLGLCLCPQDMDTSPYVTMYDTNKEMCYEDMCNAGEQTPENET
jgi:hypothetical protein